MGALGDKYKPYVFWLLYKNAAAQQQHVNVGVKEIDDTVRVLTSFIEVVDENAEPPKVSNKEIYDFCRALIDAGEECSGELVAKHFGMKANTLRNRLGWKVRGERGYNFSGSE